MQNKIIFILILAIFGIIAGGFYILTEQKDIEHENIYLEKTGSLNATSTASTTENFAKETEQELEKESKENKKIEKELIYIGKKNPGKNIDIDVVILRKGGFVIIYENTFEPTGELLAISKYLSAGEHVRVPLHLFREAKDGEVFTAMLHADDGDKIFDLSKDVPVRDDKGEGVYTELIIEDFMPNEETVDEEDGSGEEGGE